MPPNKILLFTKWNSLVRNSLSSPNESLLDEVHWAEFSRKYFMRDWDIDWHSYHRLWLSFLIQYMTSELLPFISNIVRTERLEISVGTKIAALIRIECGPNSLIFLSITFEDYAKTIWFERDWHSVPVSVLCDNRPSIESNYKNWVESISFGLVWGRSLFVLNPQEITWLDRTRQTIPVEVGQRDESNGFKNPDHFYQNEPFELMKSSQCDSSNPI